jgi:hypothetical protein
MFQNLFQPCSRISANCSLCSRKTDRFHSNQLLCKFIPCKFLLMILVCVYIQNIDFRSKESRSKARSGGRLTKLQLEGQALSLHCV